MRPEEAALVALYPVIIWLGIAIFVRYVPVLGQLEKSGMRALVLGVLVLTATVIAEQLFYGFARLFPGQYDTITALGPVVGLLKIGYVMGFCIKLYAFWMIAPKVPKIGAPIILSLALWITCFVLLLV